MKYGIDLTPTQIHRISSFYQTCINGLIRFNANHEFNSPLHITRKGMKPKTITNIVQQWNTLLYNVEFRCCDYNEIIPQSDRDFVYANPPYSQSGSIYYGKIKFEEFLDWIRNLPCGFALSFNAKHTNLENDNDIIPHDIYTQRVVLRSGKARMDWYFNKNK